MLTSVAATTPDDNTENFTLGSISDSLQLLDVDGLGPVKAEISTSLLAGAVGETILGSSIGKRNILLKFGLNPDWATQTMAELRLQLYSYFVVNQAVTLTFTSTHLPTVEIDGVVEDFIPEIFSKDPQITVSIICGQPYFVAVDPTVYNTVAFAAATYAVLDDNVVEIPDYPGSAPTGITVKVSSSVARPSYTGTISVYNQKGSGSLKTSGNYFAVTGVAIDATHHFEMNSVPGDKRVHLIDDGGNRVNLLGAVSSTYTWPELAPGANKFGVKVSSVPNGVGLGVELSYFARFGML